MPSITALLHTENDALRLGRALETLYPCDHILIVDHASRDATVQVARDYGARVLPAQPGASNEYDLRNLTDWILCLDPRESLSESLAASLFEWKSAPKSESESPPPHPLSPALSVFLREETSAGWVDIPTAQTRLVPSSWNRWQQRIPLHDPSAPLLDGHLLRFAFP